MIVERMRRTVAARKGATGATLAPRMPPYRRKVNLRVEEARGRRTTYHEQA
jgi:hypothetical protein